MKEEARDIMQSSDNPNYPTSQYKDLEVLLMVEGMFLNSSEAMTKQDIGKILLSLADDVAENRAHFQWEITSMEAKRLKNGGAQNYRQGATYMLQSIGAEKYFDYVLELVKDTL